MATARTAVTAHRAISIDMRRQLFKPDAHIVSSSSIFGDFGPWPTPFRTGLAMGDHQLKHAGGLLDREVCTLGIYKRQHPV